MIKIIDDFFEKETLEKIQYHITHKLMFSPRYFKGTSEKTKENYYGDRFDFRDDLSLFDIFLNQSEKKFNITINKAMGGIDMRNLDNFKPHTDDDLSKLNVLVMLKGITAVTNGTVFYTDGQLDIHVGFRENRALMFPANKFHSSHKSEQSGMRRYTASIFIQEYELRP